MISLDSQFNWLPVLHCYCDLREVKGKGLESWASILRVIP